MIGKYHTRAQTFPQDRIRGRHNTGFHDLGVFHNERFQFMGVDLVSSPVNEVLAATVYADVSVRVPGHKVPRIEPSILQLFFRLLGILPIAL